MTRTSVWDPFVRIFHWTVVIAFAANAFVIDDDGKAHQMIGWLVAGLVAARIAWGFAGSRHARFAAFMPTPRAVGAHIADIVHRRPQAHLGHSPLGALMIVNLLVTLALIAGSGWLMTTDAFWGVVWPETVHEAAVAWAELSILLHVVAVVLEGMRTHVNLPKAMITGYKELPDSAE